MKPICYDLYCGLGGWAEGFLSEGYRCIGYDIEKHDYGTGTYPGELILCDVRSIHGSQLADAACIVASPPCQEPSYRAMPWKRAKALNAIGPPHLFIELFNTCFRIQREASEAAGRYIPLIVENVRGAERWVGSARWKHKTFYLWGDVPTLMPFSDKGFKGFKGFKRDWRNCEASRRYSSHSKERKQWSAEIAKIPFPLAQHIARCFKPRSERECAS